MSIYISFITIIYRLIGLKVLKYNKNKYLYLIDITTSVGIIIFANLMLISN